MAQRVLGKEPELPLFDPVRVMRPKSATKRPSLGRHDEGVGAQHNNRGEQHEKNVASHLPSLD